jgi:hypothetical protein
VHNGAQPVDGIIGIILINMLDTRFETDFGNQRFDRDRVDVKWVAAPGGTTIDCKQGERDRALGKLLQNLTPCTNRIGVSPESYSGLTRQSIVAFPLTGDIRTAGSTSTDASQQCSDLAPSVLEERCCDFTGCASWASRSGCPRHTPFK